MGAGKGLRKLRKERGLSLRDIASVTGMSLNNLCDIENEKQSPYLKTVFEIAQKNKYDMHRLAHYAFNLEEPEEFGELGGLETEILDHIINMDETETRSVLTFAKMLWEESGGVAGERPRIAEGRSRASPARREGRSSAWGDHRATGDR